MRSGSALAVGLRTIDIDNLPENASTVHFFLLVKTFVRRGLAANIATSFSFCFSLHLGRPLRLMLN